MTSPQYAVLVPVKPPAHGKSRLVGPPDDLRRELAAAFALDTVAACLAADRSTRCSRSPTTRASPDGSATLGCARSPTGSPAT